MQNFYKIEFLFILKFDEYIDASKVSFEQYILLFLKNFNITKKYLIREEIEEITEGADKQLKIQTGLQEIVSRWQSNRFIFIEWKTRGVNVLKGTGLVMEELEEAQVRLFYDQVVFKFHQSRLVILSYIGTDQYGMHFNILASI